MTSNDKMSFWIGYRSVYLVQVCSQLLKDLDLKMRVFLFHTHTCTYVGKKKQENYGRLKKKKKFT